MKRPSTAGLAAGILIIVASGALSGAGEPARSLAAQSGAAASTRQASSHQRSVAPIPVKQAGDASDVATGFMIAGPGGMYTVTAINGQTITATARGIGFAV